MIKLKDLLLEAETLPANAPITKKDVEQIGFDSPEEVEDLSFKFKVQNVPLKDNVASHQIITIEVFDLPDGYRKAVKLRPYHLIFGENSLGIFDAFGVNEVAGLNKKDCEEYIAKLAAEGKTEKDDAYIGGLCNFSGNNLFEFFNLERMKKPGMGKRLLFHEMVHIARNLISLFENPAIDPSKPKWWEDPKATFTDMTDATEEFFAEVQERTGTIADNRWDKLK